MSFGTLILIPTPIDEVSPLEKTAFDRLSTRNIEKSVVAVEELKAARKRWLHWGLPRDMIPGFCAYNEHAPAETAVLLLSELKKGKDVYLMSDGGLPAFFDPGVELVDLCHQNGIKVTSTPFPHAPALALALSGFKVQRYLFAGALPRERETRARELAILGRERVPVVLMETPYRAKKLLEEILELHSGPLTPGEREVFVALDLNGPGEFLWRGKAHALNEILKKMQKAEPVVILGPIV